MKDAIGQEINIGDKVAHTCLGRDAPARYSVHLINDNGLVTIIRNSCDVRTVYPYQLIVFTSNERVLRGDQVLVDKVDKDDYEELRDDAAELKYLLGID